MATVIDINSDLGESFGSWSMGDDEAMLEIVTSSNIACGFHAGDPLTMRKTIAAAKVRGVSIGAHVGYSDLVGYGRRDLDIASAELIADVTYQIAAIQGLANALGTSVNYVKPHGALYNRIVHDPVQASAVVEAICEVDDSLAVLGLPNSQFLYLAEKAGLRSVHEAYADRAYTPEGTLVPRSKPGAVLHDPIVIADRMVRLVSEGFVEAIDGSTVRVDADSICVHGDTAGSVQIAQAVRARLTESGIELGPFAAGAIR